MMTLTATCQRCHERVSAWQVGLAEVNIGTIQHWKMQVCEECASQIEAALIPLLAIRKPKERAPDVEKSKRTELHQRGCSCTYCVEKAGQGRA